MINDILKNNLSRIVILIESPIGNFELFISFILITCTVLIFYSVINSFIKHNKHKVKREKRSVVETGTMTMFFIVFYFLVRLQIGVIPIKSYVIQLILVVLNTIVMVIGTYVNVKGRSFLGENWANQIKLYDNHKLLETGLYAMVRHPLYASLIWMFTAASFLYHNLSALLATIVIFIPFMYYRAKQEETLLVKTYPRYKKYRKRVGMFFPKLKYFMGKKK